MWLKYSTVISAHGTRINYDGISYFKRKIMRNVDKFDESYTQVTYQTRMNVFYLHLDEKTLRNYRKFKGAHLLVWYEKNCHIEKYFLTVFFDEDSYPHLGSN